MSRLGRLAPLCGLLFTVLGMAAFATANGAPDAKASGESVLAFVKTNSTAMQTSDTLWLFAFAFLVFFAGSVRALLRQSPAAEPASAVALAGAAMFAVGAAAYFGMDLTLGVDGSHLAPAAAQALNVLALAFVLPLCIGGFVFGLASGAAILRGDLLPHWLGWVAVLLGLVAMTPAVLAAVVGYFVWVAIMSVLVYRRGPADPS